jgi:predicted nuclease of predicted toxin-antitoxin system
MDAADSEIMAYAAKHDYVVLTHDLDFSAILAATQSDVLYGEPELLYSRSPGGKFYSQAAP